MAHFFRIYNNQLSSLGEVKKIGFDINDAYAIPDEYLEQGEFVVMRTCHGIGDWSIISAMPRLLKQKYPGCKVYVPSTNMLRTVFGEMLNTWGYGTYDCSNITLDIFKNNPYVDAFIDSANEDIFHDHYRIYDDNINTINVATKFCIYHKDTFNIIDSTMDSHCIQPIVSQLDNAIIQYKETK